MLFDLMFYGPWSILILLPGLFLGIYAQTKVKTTFGKYSKVHSKSGISASYVAKELLQKENVQGVKVTKVAGSLTDHYNPKTETVALSSTVYDSTSVAAIGVAAHEIGHVIQKHRGYFPMKVRAAFYPIVKIGSMAFVPLLLIGLMIEIFAGVGNGISNILINLGIFGYGLATLFALITLPVEFNASSRAKKALVKDGILTPEEANQAGKVLNAAALTYVAGFVTSLLYFLRFLLIMGRMRGND